MVMIMDEGTDGRGHMFHTLDKYVCKVPLYSLQSYPLTGEGVPEYMGSKFLILSTSLAMMVVTMVRIMARLVKLGHLFWVENIPKGALGED